MRICGSHRQFKHPMKWGRWGLVTVTGHSGYDLAVGALDNILRQAR
ncbi:MAG: type II toxin-antitoxin system HicA family toxin [Thiotrichales bacterium]|nr:type II toxin-antitoxin system HicA family toxin [Thiotrichales bacterium]MCY4285006.1 type II toxin-antitoxin system HicA family toxin [Thiotrichales bacterium]MCY4351359.1 type II toxin-antitoxin system HicA family toxin [Thiotrichales bacterium]